MQKYIYLLNGLVIGAAIYFAAFVCAAGVDDPNHRDIYLLMIKSKNELSVRSLSDPTKIYKSYRAISGLNPGDKNSEGDKRTPEGIYFVERRVAQNELREIHGSAGFILNYPNPIDRLQSHHGSGIWIHGVDRPERVQKSYDTLGCIAMANADVLDLATFLKAQVPVVIVPDEASASNAGLEPLNGAYAQRMQAWATAWASRDAEQYLSFYHKDFHTRSMNLTAWSQYKRRLAKTYKSIQVGLENLKILRHGKYSIVFFKQNYASDRFQSMSYKHIYLYGPAERAQIVLEEVTSEMSGPQLASVKEAAL